MKTYKIFFDFDNTLTFFDVLDELIRRFSINENWRKIEEDWQEGRIGSRECLEKQLSLIRISKKQLLEYLFKIKIDAYFLKILDLLKRKNIRPVILSDSFSFIIKNILANNHIDIKRVKLYANSLKFKKDRLIPIFPHKNNSCILCAHCKRNNLLKNAKNATIKIYVGDGLSDFCPAQETDIIFAKDTLFKKLRTSKKQLFSFRSLKEVYLFLKERL